MTNEQAEARKRVDELTRSLASEREEAELARLYIERAHCYCVLEDDGKSVADYLSALDHATDSAQIVHIRSMISLAFLSKADNRENAIWWAVAAVDRDPRNAEGLYTLGLNCEYSEFYDVAVEAFSRAVDSQPDHSSAERHLGVCLREACRLEEAVLVLTRYVDRNPDDAGGWYELGWTVHLSIALPDRVARAKVLYLEALRHNPSDTLRRVITRKLEQCEMPYPRAFDDGGDEGADSTGGGENRGESGPSGT